MAANHSDSSGAEFVDSARPLTLPSPPRTRERGKSPHLHRLHPIQHHAQRLEARAGTDGSLLWSWTPPVAIDTSFLGEVLVTDNLVFVSTYYATYALKLRLLQLRNARRCGCLLDLILRLRGARATFLRG